MCLLYACVFYVCLLRAITRETGGIAAYFRTDCGRWLEDTTKIKLSYIVVKFNTSTCRLERLGYLMRRMIEVTSTSFITHKDGWGMVGWPDHHYSQNRRTRGHFKTPITEDGYRNHSRSQSRKTLKTILKAISVKAENGLIALYDSFSVVYGTGFMHFIKSVKSCHLHHM